MNPLVAMTSDSSLPSVLQNAPLKKWSLIGIIAIILLATGYHLANYALGSMLGRMLQQTTVKQ